MHEYKEIIFLSAWVFVLWQWQKLSRVFDSACEAVECLLQTQPLAMFLLVVLISVLIIRKKGGDAEKKNVA